MVLLSRKSSVVALSFCVNWLNLKLNKSFTVAHAKIGFNLTFVFVTCGQKCYFVSLEIVIFRQKNVILVAHALHVVQPSSIDLVTNHHVRRCHQTSQQLHRGRHSDAGDVTSRRSDYHRRQDPVTHLRRLRLRLQHQLRQIPSGNFNHFSWTDVWRPYTVGLLICDCKTWDVTCVAEQKIKTY